MTNKRPKQKVFEGLGIPVPWVGRASNDTGHPETLGAPTTRHSQQCMAGVPLWVSPSLPRLWGSRSTPQNKPFSSFAFERGFFRY